ncbi:MAG TPA: hypothetical protein VF453_07945 [Burkholderiaceae bacterium]
MKLTLTQDLIYKMSLDKAPILGSKPQAFEAVEGPNYLVIDDHRESPPGFAARVGKLSTTYLVDKVVAGKRMKIHVGLARGRKGSEKPVSLADARARLGPLADRQEARRQPQIRRRADRGVGAHPRAGVRPLRGLPEEQGAAGEEELVRLAEAGAAQAQGLGRP